MQNFRNWHICYEWKPTIGLTCLRPVRTPIPSTCGGAFVMGTTGGSLPHD